MALKFTTTALAMVLFGMVTTGCNSSDEAPGATPAATGAVTLDPDVDDGEEPAPYRTGETETERETMANSGEISTRTTDAETANVAARISGNPNAEPVSPTTAPAESMVNALYETVSFEGATETLTEESTDRLNKLAEQVQEGSPLALSVQIQNYTASTKVEPGNDVLAQKRAAVIANYLESQGAEVAGWTVDTLAGDAGQGPDMNPAMAQEQQPVVIAVVTRDQGEVTSTTVE